MRIRTLLLALGLLAAVFLPRGVFAATLYMDPATTTAGPGDTFITSVRLDNGQDCINAVNIELTYPKDTLRAVDFSRGDSIFSLWAVEPKIDTDTGIVTFAGGIPGGYCGRITGDAAQSNVLGSVVFTVVSAKAPTASIRFTGASSAYVNDGQGTLAAMSTRGADITLSPVALHPGENSWLSQVKSDTNPPLQFNVDVESTAGVFDGKYYLVFSTSDKESGLDHFEIYEHGGWKRITSPYMPREQSILGVGDIQLRAVDKAGNMTLGIYSASSTPQRQLTAGDFMPFLIFALIVLVLGIKMRIDQRKKEKSDLPSTHA